MGETRNISKEKREKLLEKIGILKEYFKNNKDLDINETNKYLDYLFDVEKEVNGKKYGLVYEEHEEEIDRILKTHVPYLVEDEDLYIDNGGQMNFIIEGDNLASLKLLEKTHKGRIDVIYIDPPYNTGREDFIYCDEYVNLDDNYKNSKWLSFMKKRLEIAKKILSSQGVIFISIDDREQANLEILCNEIYDKSNNVATFIWTNNEGGGGSDSKYIKTKHEYILCFAKNINDFKTKNVEIEDEDRYKLADEYVETRGKYQLVKLSSASIQYSQSLDYKIEMPDGTCVEPVDNTDKDRACWRWSKNKLKWGLDNGFIVYKKDKKSIWQVYTKQYINCDKDGNIVRRTKTPLALIDRYSSTQASTALIDLFNEKIFNYPKPVELIKWLIDRVPNKNSVICDFFAGSGTTGQAVLELNKEDGGNRKFILCTNNENNICKEVTYQRMKTVITGKRKNGSKYSDGLAGSLKYMKVEFENKENKLYEEYSQKLEDHIKSLIELQYAINLDDSDEYKLLLTDEEKEEFCDDILKSDNNIKLKKIFIGREILYDKDLEKVKQKLNVDIVEVPSAYYEEV